MQDSQAQVQNVPIDRFNDYIRQLGRALSFPEDQIEVLIQSFQYFNRQDRYRLITDTQRYVDNLLIADQELQRLPNTILQSYMPDIRDNWNAMNEQLAQLQILSLIQKKEDCQEVIKQLLKILNDKIKTVNDVLRANLGQPNPQSSNPVQSQSGESSNPSSANLVQSQLGDSGQSSNPSSATLVRPQSGELRPSSIPSSATLVRPTDLQNRFADSARLVSDPSLRFQSAVQNQMQNFGPRKMQGGSNDDIYMKKYLKYKNKYLSLKNRI